MPAKNDPTVSTSARAAPDDRFSWAVRYQAINAVEADPALPESWSEFVQVVESELEANDLFDQHVRLYGADDRVRNIELVKAPKVPWIAVRSH